MQINNKYMVENFTGVVLECTLSGGKPTGHILFFKFLKEKMKKKILALALAATMAVSSLVGCSASAAKESTTTTVKQTTTQAPTTTQATTTTAPTTTASNDVVGEEAATAPKYVFLFIGDGMSYPQIQSAADYLGALNDEDYFMAQPSLSDNQGAILDGPEYLNFMNFEAAGSAVTYDSNSFAPDSASTATSIATGYKTYACRSSCTCYCAFA